VYEKVITAGFDLLEGNETIKANEDMKYLVHIIEESNGLKISPASWQRLLLSIATLQWFLTMCNIFVAIASKITLVAPVGSVPSWLQRI
jgi:hypothetical protein